MNKSIINGVQWKLENVQHENRLFFFVTFCVSSGIYTNGAHIIFINVICKVDSLSPCFINNERSMQIIIVEGFLIMAEQTNSEPTSSIIL